MIGTTLKLLTRQPELLLNYVFAYSTLARNEIALAKLRLVRRVIAGAIAFAAMLAFLILSGVALILVSASSHAIRLAANCNAIYSRFVWRWSRVDERARQYGHDGKEKYEPLD
jgi:hypothetical protein